MKLKKKNQNKRNKKYEKKVLSEFARGSLADDYNEVQKTIHHPYYEMT